MSDVLSWIGSVLVALVSGTVGGVFLAPKIGMRTAQGERRYQAVSEIRRALEAYRSSMAYRHAEVSIKQCYPVEYVSLRSQEHLAEQVLRELPYLPKRQQRLLRRYLLVLVGAWTVRYAEGRVSLPNDVRDEDSEKAWTMKAIADALESGDQQHLSHGQLGEVKRNVTNMSAYTAAIATLDEMVRIVPARRDLRLTLNELRFQLFKSNAHDDAQ